MPFCDVGEYGDDVVDGTDKTGLEEGCVQLFYQLFGHGNTKVLLIPGVAATHEAWGPQLLALCGTVESNEEEEEKRTRTRRTRTRTRELTHCTHHEEEEEEDDDDDGAAAAAAITELARRRTRRRQRSSECEEASYWMLEEEEEEEIATSSRTEVQVCDAFDDENRGAATAASSRIGVQVFEGNGVQVCGAFDDENRGAATAASSRIGVQVLEGNGVQVCSAFDDENRVSAAATTTSSATGVQVDGSFDDKNRGPPAARSSATGAQVCGGFDDQKKRGLAPARRSRSGVQACGSFDDENRGAAAAAAASLSSGTGVQVCAFDNRGVGRSSAPKRKKAYTTTTMARDALALMDHLGWNNAHVVGHSMGGMIACKLVAIAPERVISLALISTTGGGYQCLPKIDKTMISIAYRFFRAKTPEERAHVDLDTHYTKEYLDTLVDEEYRRATLYREYVKNLSSSGMQPKHGLDGQFNACWNHNVKSHEIDRIRAAGISVAVIHGRGDIVAQIHHAKKLAKKLHPVASMTELTGGHMVTHQNAHEVNKVLLELIKSERVHHIHHSSSYKCNNKALHSDDVHSWEIWQNHSTRSITNNKDGGSGTFIGSVVAVVEVIDRLFPDWFSLLHVFPTLYWPLSWAKKSLFFSHQQTLNCSLTCSLAHSYLVAL